MKRSVLRAAALTPLLTCLNCASTPRPAALDQSAAASESRDVADAQPWAPQAFARAEQLRRLGEDAQEDGRPEQAAALSEQSVAAYQRTVVLARLARAEQRIAAAEHGLATVRAQRDAVHRSQIDVAAQANALELQYKVVRDAEPLEPITKASPAREAARRSLALSIVEEAKLLCLAARLLTTDKAVSENALATAEQRLSQLDTTLQGSPSPTPVNAAVQLRSECLGQLRDLRRDKRQLAPASDPADVLLTELAAAFPTTPPFRDDRGVVVSIHAPFDSRAQLLPAANELLTRLSAVSQAHRQFPVLLVLHGKHKQLDPATLEAALRSWLQQHPLPQVSLHYAADRLPASVTPVRGAKPSDIRLDFVFVAPQ